MAYERRRWFKAVKAVLRLIIKEPKFIYLGEEVRPGGIILSNHEGPKSPVSLELYAAVPHRQWGTHEMNEDFKTAYRYQTNIYYHQKKALESVAGAAFLPDCHAGDVPLL